MAADARPGLPRTADSGSMAAVGDAYRCNQRHDKLLRNRWAQCPDTEARTARRAPVSRGRPRARSVHGRDTYGSGPRRSASDAASATGMVHRTTLPRAAVLLRNAGAAWQVPALIGVTRADDCHDRCRSGSVRNVPNARSRKPDTCEHGIALSRHHSWSKWMCGVTVSGRNARATPWPHRSFPEDAHRLRRCRHHASRRRSQAERTRSTKTAGRSQTSTGSSVCKPRRST
jgi:hypothetical protein